MKKRPQTVFGLVVLVPVVIWYLVLSFRPVVMSFRMALVDYELLNPSESEWVGMQHFITLFTSYKLFWKSVRNTLMYSFFINVATVPLSILFAFCLVSVGKRARNRYQWVLFLPVVVSMAAMALLFKILMDPSGILNYALGVFGIPPSKWLASPASALYSLAMVSIWKGLGSNIVILAAGLMSIPSEMYDAASVDGASGWHTFWWVTIPLLMPSLKLITILVVIGSLQAYTSAVVMTNGGPANSTLMISQFIMGVAFDGLRFGLASSAAFLLFIVIFSITLLQLRVMKREWEY